MDDRHAVFPLPPPAADTTAEPDALPPPRWLATVQVILVCGIPTQMVIAAVLAFGMRIPLFDEAGGLSFEFVAITSLADTALVAALIGVFLSSSGERPADVFVGKLPVRGEVLRGLALLPVVFLIVASMVLGLRTVAPWMHNVETSPFEAFMSTPHEAAIFLVVVVLAGGIREELQRAFILHRFDQRLGGIKLGLLLFTVMFGVFHMDQGYDVAAAITLLGLMWGVLYARRRSAVLPMVNHASFNAAQVVQAVVSRSFGV